MSIKTKANCFITYMKNRFAKLPRKKFDWEEFKKGKIAVNCKTKELAKDFLKQADEQGIRWNSEGDKTTDYTYWETCEENTCYDTDYTYWEMYEENTCYDTNDRLQYCYTEYYKVDGYKIIDWEDYR